MNRPGTTLKIETLGCFRISVAGKPVAATWPDEALKMLFCSLLSPLDLYFTWDRICRSTMGVPETRTSRCQLEEVFIRPLNSFLIRELGFTPLIAGHESIRIDKQRINVDALEFHSAAIEGLRLLSINNNSAALTKIGTAISLYAGTFLPDMTGKIIVNTRNELASLHRTAVMAAEQLARNAGNPGVA